MEAKKAEYDDLVTKRIPQNRQDIQIARSYGDLRENFEYKSAKEQQRVLSRQKSEVERDLARARGTDFSETKGDQVGIGTT
jgi:transcription elongation GreA/GreB family factor